MHCDPALLANEVDGLINDDLFSDSGKLNDLAVDNDGLQDAIYNMLNVCAKCGPAAFDYRVDSAVKTYQAALRNALEPEAMKEYKRRYCDDFDR